MVVWFNSLWLALHSDDDFGMVYGAIKGSGGCTEMMLMAAFLQTRVGERRMDGTFGTS